MLAPRKDAVRAVSRRAGALLGAAVLVSACGPFAIARHAVPSHSSADTVSSAAATPHGERAIANELVSRINKERSSRKRTKLKVDPYLTWVAQVWANHLADTHQFMHQDLGKVLQSNNRLVSVGENMFGGAGPGATDAGTAHVTLMHSAGHRANILLQEQRFVGIGVACRNGSLLVVEDFGIPFGVTLHPHGVPRMDPIASKNEGGASC